MDLGVIWHHMSCLEASQTRLPISFTKSSICGWTCLICYMIRSHIAMVDIMAADMLMEAAYVQMSRDQSPGSL
jgi:hypothetical protein